MQEIWKDIQGWKGVYQISNNGNVKSFERLHFINAKGGYCIFPERVLKVEKLKSGYLRVQLSSKGIKEKILVHVLVAKHFVDGYSDGKEVNHKDGDKENNCDWNLSWVTKSENVKHSYDVLNRNRDVQKNKKAVLVENETEKYEFESIQLAARSLRISASNIYEAAKYGRKTKGFSVLFAERDFELNTTLVS